MNRLTIAAIFGLGCSMYLYGENGPTNLEVWAKDGTKVCYALTEQPKVTFTEESLVITTNGVEVSYPLEQMRKFIYVDNLGVEDIKLDDPNVKPFRFDGETLIFPNLLKDTGIYVYSTDGKQMLSRFGHAGETVIVPLKDLNKGLYLVKVNSITYKILKK